MSVTAANHDVSIGRSSVGLVFPSIYRLRKTDEYSSVFAFRRTIRGDYFVLHFVPNDRSVSSIGARFGTVVAKKLVKSSVRRNLIKRLAKERFRHVRDTLASYDLVLRLSKPVVNVTREQLRVDIASLLARLPK